SYGDWSSDVCSSDLWSEAEATGSLSTRWFHALFAGKTGQCRAAGRRNACAADPGRSRSAKAAETDATRAFMAFPSAEESPILSRSEERRVGKECRLR